MKYFLSILTMLFLLNACKKSDGNAVPVIKFKSITGEFKNQDPTGPFLIISVKDKDGDFGYSDNDSSFIYVKNISNPPFRIDSFKFPSNLTGANIVNNEFELETNLRFPSSNGNTVLGPQIRTTRDTMYFEVYVRDFKRNKSNVLKTADPLIYIY